jgi:hypothetical protein
MKNEGFTPSNILKHAIKALQLPDWDERQQYYLVEHFLLFCGLSTMFYLKIIYPFIFYRKVKVKMLCKLVDVLIDCPSWKFVYYFYYYFNK